MSQTQAHRSPDRSRQPRGEWLALGVGLGTCLGAALGYLLHDLSMTLPLGMLFGAAIGLLLDSLPRRRETDEEQSPANEGGTDGEQPLANEGGTAHTATAENEVTDGGPEP